MKKHNNQQHFLINNILYHIKREIISHNNDVHVIYTHYIKYIGHDV